MNLLTHESINAYDTFVNINAIIDTFAYIIAIIDTFVYIITFIETFVSINEFIETFVSILHIGHTLQLRSTYYTGDLASEVIIATVEARIRNFEDLIQSNFSILFASQRFLPSDKIWVADAPETRNASGNVGKRLLKILENAEVTGSDEQLLQNLMFKAKKASIQLWPMILKHASEGNKMIRDKKYLKKGAMLAKNCVFIRIVTVFSREDTKRNCQKRFRAYLKLRNFKFVIRSGLELACRTRLREDNDHVRRLEMNKQLLDILWLLLIT